MYRHHQVVTASSLERPHSKNAEDTMGIGKVLLVFANHPMEPLMPLGVAILATLLEDHGFEVKLFDTTFYPSLESDNQTERVISGQIKAADYSLVGVKPKTTNMYGDFVKMVDDFAPDLIALSCVEPTYRMSLRLIEQIKECETPVVFGGVFASFSPSLVLQSGLVDMVCVGEGEEAIVEIAKRVLQGKDPQGIPNVWWQKDHQIFPAPSYKLMDVNSLPIPRFDVFEPERIYRSMAGKIYRMIPVEISRGCPYRCTYCSAPAYRKMFSDQGLWLRFKSVQKIIQEIEYYLQNTSVEYFYFVSETFLAMPPYERESFYKLYNKYSLPFWFNTRPETVNRKDIHALADIGCHRLSVGIEHGNPEFRRRMLQRNYSNKAVVDAVNIIQETNIQISVNNMIGFPDETRELVFDTINLNREFSCDSHTVSIFQPFKGTKLYDYCVGKKYWSEDKIAAESFAEPVLSMPTLSKDEIRGLYKTFNLYRQLDKSYWPDIRRAELEDEEGRRIFEDLYSLGNP